MGICQHLKLGYFLVVALTVVISERRIGEYCVAARVANSRLWCIFPFVPSEIEQHIPSVTRSLYFMNAVVAGYLCAR